MDSLLSLQTPNPPPVTFPHPLPDISTPAPNYAVSSSPTANIAGGVPLPSLLVPKSEPFDEFLATQDPQQQPCGFSPAEGSDDDQVHDLYTEFFRVSELFRRAFGQTFPAQFGAEDAIANSPKHANANSPRHPNPQSCDGNAVVSDQDPNSRAIVPVPAATQESTVTVARRRQSRAKVKELVRVTDLSVRDQMHFREVVRRTRMIYDSLRVLASVEEEKRAAAEGKRAAAAGQPAEPQPEPEALNGNNGIRTPAEPQPGPEPEVLNGKNGIRRRCRSRIRGDLRAAALMRERGLWLNREKRIVGAIPGVFVGDLFFFRMELCVVGLHNQIQAGIDYLPSSMSSNGEPIATSVIVSGGYEDDVDDGEVIVYTGQGGQEKNSSRQVSDQKLVGGNLALERSMHYGIEVRVIRGMRYEGSASGSGKVYVYDGLYKIVDCWFDVGKSGFGVYKYKLWRIEGQAKMGSAVLKDARDVRRSGLDFKPVYCLSVDISNKRENVAIRLFNDIDDNKDPLCFEYLPRTSFPQFVFHQSGKATGCDCVDGCADGCFCSMKNGGEFPYNQQGFLVRGKPLIFECGPFCTCPPHCRNRVTQKGIKNRLEVFRSRQTGWGVRSLDLIHAGSFICEYTGVVLTREQAQILTMNGDSLIYPNRFSERWAEWGDLSQIYSDYVRPSYPSIPPLDVSLDVSTMRNVACYISHSSSPNVLVQFVLYDHNNLMFPHLMLFAMENIPPMRELSLDYGVADEWTGKLSICN